MWHIRVSAHLLEVTWLECDQLGQLAGYKWFTDWSNNTWQMGNPTRRKIQRGVNCVTACRVYYWPYNSLCRVLHTHTIKANTTLPAVQVSQFTLPFFASGGWNFRFQDYFRLIARCIIHACARPSYTMSSARIIGPKWQGVSGWHSSCLVLWVNSYKCLTMNLLNYQFTVLNSLETSLWMYVCHCLDQHVLGLFWGCMLCLTYWALQGIIQPECLCWRNSVIGNEDRHVMLLYAYAYGPNVWDLFFQDRKMLWDMSF